MLYSTVLENETHINRYRSKEYAIAGETFATDNLAIGPRLTFPARMEIPVDVEGKGGKGEERRVSQLPSRDSHNILIHPSFHPSPPPPTRILDAFPLILDIEGRVARRRTAIILKSIKCHRGFLSRSNVRSAQAPRHPNLRRVRRRIIDEAARLSLSLSLYKGAAKLPITPLTRKCAPARYVTLR